MKTEKVMVTMIRESGNDWGFIYPLSKKDADYVEKEIKAIIKYCESRKLESE